MLKTVTIHSDGTGPGMVIIDENGNKLEGVISAIFRMSAGDFNVVDLEIISPPAQVSATVDEVVFICPVCEGSVTHECRPITLGGT